MLIIHEDECISGRLESGCEINWVRPDVQGDLGCLEIYDKEIDQCASADLHYVFKLLEAAGYKIEKASL